MKFNLSTSVSLMLLLVFASVSTGQEQKLIDFERDIKPIFANHCNQCHVEDSDDDQEPYLDDKDATLEFVVKGKPDESDLYKAVVSDNPNVLMPPPDNDYDAKKLTEEQAALIHAWIEQQAPWEGETGVMPSFDQPADEPQEENRWWELWEVVGLFHPAVVHFPVALLVVSALFAIGGLRGSYVGGDVAYYCLWIGALGAVVAAVMGWSFTMDQTPDKAWDDFGNAMDPENKFFWHGWGGIAIAVLSMVVAIYAKISRKKDPSRGHGWMLCTFVLAGVVGWVGHEGGELTYPDNYKPAWEFVDKLRGKENAPKKNDAANDGDEKASGKKEQDGDKKKDDKSPNENVKLDDD